MDAGGAELAVIDAECGLSPAPYVLAETTAGVLSAEPGPVPTAEQCLDRLEVAPVEKLTFGGEGGVFCFVTDRGRVVGAVVDRSAGAPFTMTVDAWE